MIESQDFSTPTLLLRVTAHVLRAVKLFKRSSSQPRGPLYPEELVEAERLWVSDTKTQLKTESNLRVWKTQFDLFADDRGLIRCRGRLENADLQYSSKYPSFLPRYAHLTTSIVRMADRRVMYNGVKETLTEVRKIVKGRILVQSIIHRCVDRSTM